MAKETFVIFIDFIMDECIFLCKRSDSTDFTKAADNLFQNWFVENKIAAIHYLSHIVTREQFTFSG